MARPREDLRSRSLLDGTAEIQDQHCVGEMPHHVQIVRDEHQREPEFVAKVHQQVQDLRLDRDVERRDRLVGDQDSRPQHERTRDRNALALPTGEHVRVTRLVLGCEADLAHDHARRRGARGSVQ